MLQFQFMKRTIANFLRCHADFSRPMLIGLSGGPDSLLLFHLLLELKQEKPLQLAVAHIDHGWRDSSSQEAAQLQAYVTSLGLAFHLKTLSPKDLKGNLEAACREQRLQFFRELSQAYGYQAVLLGHHADDQTETILKKIFECSHMGQLVGLQSILTEDRLTLWRPMLSTRKNDILKMCEQFPFTPFDDATNRDSRYLRSRLRHDIIPSLSKAFGKEIAPSLVRLSRDALALQKYLDDQVVQYLERIFEGPFGTMLDLHDVETIAEVELKHLLRLFMSRYGMALPDTLLEAAVHFLDSRAANKELHYRKQRIVIDRGRLFIFFCKNANTIVNEAVPLIEGKCFFGNWHIEVCPLSSSAECKATDWRSAWQGHFSAILPEDTYYLAAPRLSDSSLRKKWQNQRAPACLRAMIPVIYSQECVAQELLTGITQIKPTATNKLCIIAKYLY